MIITVLIFLTNKVTLAGTYKYFLSPSITFILFDFGEKWLFMVLYAHF